MRDTPRLSSLPASVRTRVLLVFAILLGSAVPAIAQTDGEDVFPLAVGNH